MTPAQLRAARHLLGLSQAEVAERAGLSVPTVKRVRSERDVPVSEDAIHAVRTALEAAGVQFIEQNGGGPGVRLRRSKPTS